MERNYEPISEENYIFAIDLFGMRLVFGKRDKNKNGRLIDLNINTETIKNTFNKFVNWLNSLFEEPKKEE